MLLSVKQELINIYSSFNYSFTTDELEKDVKSINDEKQFYQNKIEQLTQQRDELNNPDLLWYEQSEDYLKLDDKIYFYNTLLKDVIQSHIEEKFC